MYSTSFAFNKLLKKLKLKLLLMPKKLKVLNNGYFNDAKLREFLYLLILVLKHELTIYINNIFAVNNIMPCFN